MACASASASADEHVAIIRLTHDEASEIDRILQSGARRLRTADDGSRATVLTLQQIADVLNHEQTLSPALGGKLRSGFLEISRLKFCTC